MRWIWINRNISPIFVAVKQHIKRVNTCMCVQMEPNALSDVSKDCTLWKLWFRLIVYIYPNNKHYQITHSLTPCTRGTGWNKRFFFFSGDKLILSTHFMKPDFNVNRPLYNWANEYALTLIFCVYYLVIYLFTHLFIWIGCQIENTLSDDFPLPVKEVTKPGNLQFINPGCNGIVQNSGWYYRLSSTEWIAGPRNIFSIRAVPNDGSSLNLQVCNVNV